MNGHECHHCRQWVAEDEAHDCWTTTEAALTADLSEDLQEAWERLRKTAAGFGDQRVYASHRSIMFSRGSCYFFVRPKRTFLELSVFLGRAVDAPQVRRIDRVSKSKLRHTIPIRHRDEVEPPITDWLAEAYALSDTPVATRAAVCLGRRLPVALRRACARVADADTSRTGVSVRRPPHRLRTPAPGRRSPHRRGETRRPRSPDGSPDRFAAGPTG